MRIKLSGLFTQPRIADVIVLIAGLLFPFAFAPYQLPYLAFPLLAVFAYLLLNQSNKRSFWRGWLFGFGQFVVGFSWIFHSVHTYGHAPATFAIVLIILLAAYCALFPGLAALLTQKFFSSTQTLFLLAGLPFMWALTEWLRGYLFTGFPWLSLGVSQTDTSLAFFAPLFGSLGVAVLMLLLAGLVIQSVLTPSKGKVYLPVVALVFVLGQLLSFVNWSKPVSEAMKVSVPQLSIHQDQKWRAVNKKPSMKWYLDQTIEHGDSDIVVWPETAIPSFIKRVEPYWERVKAQAKKSDTDVVAGVFMRNPETGRYFNSMVSTNGDFYQKKHLVPLGEYMPFRGLFEFIRKFVQFPMSDIASGLDDQPLMKVAGFEVGVSICFEDVFDREIRSTLPEAKFLINASNDGWFKVTAEPFQHHQIARMRALESSRYLIRATNTGVSSLIGPKGESLVVSKMYDRNTITGEIYAMSGSTLYVLLGNWPVILLALSLLSWRVYLIREKKNTPAGV